jgi:hypothetical protein
MKVAVSVEPTILEIPDDQLAMATANGVCQVVQAAIDRWLRSSDIPSTWHNEDDTTECLESVRAA